ncbi:hypothetical protein ABIA32_003841 [Streptacidiphilus sp. MAP12-20]|uniref:hypothetical protein n=1 Tax=Streptacidiphilus sp. MAP12-20 TaxID=3156299 RepID=UPI003511D54B
MTIAMRERASAASPRATGWSDNPDLGFHVVPDDVAADPLPLADIREHGDEADLADLDRPERELAERRARKDGRPRRRDS